MKDDKKEVLKYQKMDPRNICKRWIPILLANEPNDVFKKKLDTFLDTPMDSKEKMYVLRILLSENAQLLKNF